MVCSLLRSGWLEGSGMGRLSARDRPERERVLVPVRRLCPACGMAMRIRYENRRTLVTLSGSVMPQHEFGLDVVALVGALQHRDHRSAPEIHAVVNAA